MQQQPGTPWNFREASERLMNSALSDREKDREEHISPSHFPSAKVNGGLLRRGDDALDIMTRQRVSVSADHYTMEEGDGSSSPPIPLLGKRVRTRESDTVEVYAIDLALPAASAAVSAGAPGTLVNSSSKRPQGNSNSAIQGQGQGQSHVIETEQERAAKFYGSQQYRQGAVSEVNPLVASSPSVPSSLVHPEGGGLGRPTNHSAAFRHERAETRLQVPPEGAVFADPSNKGEGGLGGYQRRTETPNEQMRVARNSGEVLHPESKRAPRADVSFPLAFSSSPPVPESREPPLLGSARRPPPRMPSTGRGASSSSSALFAGGISNSPSVGLQTGGGEQKGKGRVGAESAGIRGEGRGGGRGVMSDSPFTPFRCLSERALQKDTRGVEREKTRAVNGRDNAEGAHAPAPLQAPIELHQQAEGVGEAVSLSSRARLMTAGEAIKASVQQTKQPGETQVGHGTRRFTPVGPTSQQIPLESRGRSSADGVEIRRPSVVGRRTRPETPPTFAGNTEGAGGGTAREGSRGAPALRERSNQGRTGIGGARTNEAEGGQIADAGANTGVPSASYPPSLPPSHPSTPVDSRPTSVARPSGLRAQTEEELRSVAVLGKERERAAGRTEGGGNNMQRQSPAVPPSHPAGVQWMAPHPPPPYPAPAPAVPVAAPPAPPPAVATASRQSPALSSAGRLYAYFFPSQSPQTTQHPYTEPHLNHHQQQQQHQLLIHPPAPQTAVLGVPINQHQLQQAHRSDSSRRPGRSLSATAPASQSGVAAIPFPHASPPSGSVTSTAAPPGARPEDSGRGAEPKGGPSNACPVQEERREETEGANSAWECVWELSLERGARRLTRTSRRLSAEAMRKALWTLRTKTRSGAAYRRASLAAESLRGGVTRLREELSGEEAALEKERQDALETTTLSQHEAIEAYASARLTEMRQRREVQIARCLEGAVTAKRRAKIQHGLCVLEAVVSLLLGRARLSALLAARQGEPTETAASAVARRHLSRLAALRENEKETESGGKGGSPSSSVLLQGLVSSEAQLWRAVCDRVNETASRREQKSKRKAESVAGALLLGSSTKRATVRHLSWAMGRLHALCVAAAASEKAFKTVSSVPCSKSLPPADSGTSKKIPPTAPGDGHSRGRGGMMGGTSLSASAIPSTSASSASTAVAPAGVGRSGAVEVFGSGGLNVSRERERGHGGVPRPRPPPRRESEKDANDLLTATAAAVGGGAEQREPSDASREGRSAYRGRELGVPKGGVSVRRTRSRSFVRSRVDGVTGDEVIRSVCYACDDDDSPRGEKLGLNENEGEGGKEKRHESTQLDPDCEGKEKQAESGKKEEGGNKKEKEEKKTPPEASKAFPHSPPNWPSESEMGGGTQTHPNEAIDTVSSAAPPLGPGGPTQMGGVSGGPLDSHLEAEKDRPRVAWPPEDAGEGDDEGQQQQQQQQQQGGRDREVPVTIVVSPSAHLSGVEAGLVEEGKEGDGFPWGGEAESATEELLVSSVKKEKRRRAPESTQQENGLAVQVQESQQEEFEKGGAGGRGSGEGEEREFEVPWGGEAEAGREEILGGEEAGLFESPRRRLPEAGRTLTPPRECPFSPVAPGCAPKGSPDRFSASQSQGERAQPQGGVAHEGASAMTDTLGRSEGRLEREEEGGDREGSPLLPMVRIGDWSDAVLVEIWGRTGSDGMPRDFCGEVWVHGPILSQMPFRNDSLCRIFLKLGQPSAASLTGKGRTRGAFRKEPNPNLEEEREPEGEGDTLATQSHHHLRLGPFLDVQLDWIRAGRDAVLRLSVIEAQGLRPPPSFLEPLEDLSGGNRGAPHLGVPSDAGSRGGLQTFRPVAAVWVRDGVTGVFNCLHITAPAQVSYTQGSPQSTHAGGSSSASGQRKRFVWNETFDLRLNLQIMHKQQQQQPH